MLDLISTYVREFTLPVPDDELRRREEKRGTKKIKASKGVVYQFRGIISIPSA